MSDTRRAQLSEHDFRPIVLKKQVVFESWLGETKSDHILGYVRVANRSHQKRVFVRYTRDNWETTLEVEAYWVETVAEETDKFIFVIPFPTDWSGTIKFAIRYEVRGDQYWDNNQEMNHVVKVGENSY